VPPHRYSYLSHALFAAAACCPVLCCVALCFASLCFDVLCFALLCLAARPRVPRCLQKHLSARRPWPYCIIDTPFCPRAMPCCAPAQPPTLPPLPSAAVHRYAPYLPSAQLHPPTYPVLNSSRHVLPTWRRLADAVAPEAGMCRHSLLSPIHTVLATVWSLALSRQLLHISRRHTPSMSAAVPVQTPLNQIRQFCCQSEASIVAVQSQRT
jgi:hypothetical protein